MERRNFDDVMKTAQEFAEKNPDSSGLNAEYLDEVRNRVLSGDNDFESLYALYQIGYMHGVKQERKKKES
jgi:hypothetical protein